MSLSHIYSTWRENVVLAEPHGTAVALPCTAWTDFHSVILWISLWERPDSWEIDKEEEKKKKKKRQQYLKKNRTKIWCGKINYNRFVIVMLLKWSFFNKPSKHCAIRNWLHVKSEHLQAEYALELISFFASSSLFC